MHFKHKYKFMIFILFKQNKFKQNNHMKHKCFYLTKYKYVTPAYISILTKKTTLTNYALFFFTNTNQTTNITNLLVISNAIPTFLTY